ncbi:MAG: ScpA family protein [Chloroflexi bacterium]|nr:ScpA family protein [Chloroflexota bacterium]
MTATWGPAGQASSLTGFEIDIEDFEGPLDLLVQLIEKQGLDITGVSVLAVTDQFVAYAHQLHERFAEAASEFLLVASRLALLKSRALLPQAEPEDEEESADDLAERLRIYAAFKTVAVDLDARLRAGQSAFIRVAQPSLPQPTPEPGTGDLMRLLKALEGLTQVDTPVASLIETPTRRFRVADKVRDLQAMLTSRGTLTFDAIAASCADRAELIATFVAVLHLVKQRAARVEQSGPFGAIVLTSTRGHGHG